MSVLGQPEPFRVSHHDLVHAALVEVPDSKREFKVIIRRIKKFLILRDVSKVSQIFFTFLS